jgi:hypothetical protein
MTNPPSPRRPFLTAALALALFAAGWGAHAARAATAPPPIVAPAVCAADVAALVGAGHTLVTASCTAP